MAPRRRKSKKASAGNSNEDRKDDYLSNWRESFAEYVEQTQANVLDLSLKRLGKEEVKSLLSVLPNSRVTELDLEYNCLKNSMADLALLLTKTKIRKLNVSNCRLTKDDVLHLAEVLKDSQINELIIVDNSEPDDAVNFTLGEARKFITYLREAKLTSLVFDSFLNVIPQIESTSLIQEFLDNSITSLDLSWCKLSSNNLISLFSKLGRSSVTVLNLNIWKETDNTSSISTEALQELSRRLGETKIEKLSLRGVGLDDDQLSSLVEGLVVSKVTDLNLQNQRFKSLDPLFTKLKETEIKTLNLENNYQLRDRPLMNSVSFRLCCVTSINLMSCGLSDEQGEELMESLRLSSVTTLNVSWNNFGSLTVKKLADNITEINLTDLDVSFNKISLEGSFILARCLKESKLTRISARCMHKGPYGPYSTLDVKDLFSFLKLTEGSSVSHVEMDNHHLSWDCPLVCEWNTLANTTFSKLELCDCNIQDVSDLLPYLKSTSITDLALSLNEIGDEGAVVLAGWLKETGIRRLNLTSTSIRSPGAKALALALKETNLLYLNLSENDIEDDGIEFLAEHAKNSLVTELNVSYNPGKKVLLVDKVLCPNKIFAHQLVTIFKQVAPKTNIDEFCFDPNFDSDAFAFLEKCMWFYKTIIDNPRAINILLEEKIVALSREQIFKLVFEEFPRQFGRFVACSVEADLTEHIKILEKAEAMVVTAIVESLLLHRPVYVLNEEEGILHPYVYRLMLKYKQPVCNLAIEPHGVTKIIDYFTKHGDIIGAKDLINLLQGANASSSKSVGLFF